MRTLGHLRHCEHKSVGTIRMICQRQWTDANHNVHSYTPFLTCVFPEAGGWYWNFVLGKVNNLGCRLFRYECTSKVGSICLLFFTMFSNLRPCSPAWNKERCLALKTEGRKEYFGIYSSSCKEQIMNNLQMENSFVVPLAAEVILKISWQCYPIYFPESSTKGRSHAWCSGIPHYDNATHTQKNESLSIWIYILTWVSISKAWLSIAALKLLAKSMWISSSSCHGRNTWGVND